MKAMILAAGLGTRLEHHTLERPKALVEVNGKPLLTYVIEKLIASNFRHIVINVHHFAEQIKEYIQRNNFNARIEFSDETNRLLNTGGGILKAKPFLDGDEPFLVHNVDILSDIDLLKLADYHNATNSFATLAVGKRNSSRQFLFDSTMKLAGWRNNLTGKEIITVKNAEQLSGYAFAGIHILSPEYFQKIHTKGAFSIVDAYLTLCQHETITGFDTSSNYVIDVGKPKNLEMAKEFATKLT